MTGKPEASLLVAACEQIQFLRRTLLGLVRQSFGDFETIICEDGSDPGVRKLAEGFGSRLPGGISHVWQEDEGFRKCRILNEGICRSSSDYLIFLDADCIPHARFVEGHISERERGRFLAGRRVMLGAGMTAGLADDYVSNGHLDRLWMTGTPKALSGKLRHYGAGVFFPKWLNSLVAGGNIHITGCNFSCWKSDMQAINGFNEDFVTPGGGEDTDIERRFLLSGLNSRSVKHRAVCYHQYHAAASRSASSKLYRRLAGEGEIQCARGLNLHKSKWSRTA
ncbi:MAG: glycosyltransferase [Kiritimatiellia bacterium]